MPLGPFSFAFSRVELVLAYPGDLPWNGLDQSSHELLHHTIYSSENSKVSEMEEQQMSSTRQKISGLNPASSRRKYSHPGYNSPPDTPRLSPRLQQRRKKHSLPCNSLTVINPYEVVEWSIFQKSLKQKLIFLMHLTNRVFLHSSHRAWRVAWTLNSLKS